MSKSLSRLTTEEVDQYREEGFLVYNRPVLSDAKFVGLRASFERILENLDASERPEAMDVPHFMYPELFEWAFDPQILAMVEPIMGPDLALFSTHFICKPKGNGKRVPWHEDSAYWVGMLEPMEVCTVWLAIDPSTRENGCMMVIPRTHTSGYKGFSEYDDVDAAHNVFSTEIKPILRDESKTVYIELAPNECSLHDSRVMHGSEANMSQIRRCGWTLRFCSTAVRFSQERFNGAHQVYLASGKDLGGNVYADPTRPHPEVMARRGASQRYRNAH
ncbi:MAG: phytanoyl-CoA dioxygenase family protein [Fimbriimonas sp.]|nr:phytanoyl-CoA dioxygenase family protein [Fimbriimonas sp.]